jgi:hypothetical protein
MILKQIDISALFEKYAYIKWNDSCCIFVISNVVCPFLELIEVVPEVNRVIENSEEFIEMINIHWSTIDLQKVFMMFLVYTFMSFVFLSRILILRIHVDLILLLMITLYAQVCLVFYRIFMSMRIFQIFFLFNMFNSVIWLIIE